MRSCHALVFEGTFRKVPGVAVDGVLSLEEDKKGIFHGKYTNG